MSQLQTYASAETRVLEAIFPEWRAMLARIVWGAYAALDPETPLVTLRKWGLSFTVRLKHTRRVLVLLVGEQP